ncbi:MAG TPA: transglycosylase domain-containing protein [Bacilli bacterium]|nr:transglycosylase domain-containing protein [Bacilli bacterium]
MKKIKKVNKKTTKKPRKKIDKTSMAVNKALNKIKKSIQVWKDKRKLKGKKNKSLVLIIIMYLVIALFGICVASGIYVIFSSPEFDGESLYNKEATILYDKNGDEFAKIGMEKRELVTYDELPEVLIDAIIATEDSRFFQHNGFDIARFTKAFLGQITGNSSAGGGSTLSMQVVKNTFTDPNAVSGLKGIIRKATDIYMAVFKLEKNYTKEQIIEFYVNAPWLGNNSWGVEQASQTYFGKSVKDLTLTEAAIIAGMFQAPASYNPFSSIELTTQRRNQVLNLMVRHGYITEEEAEKAKSISVESLITDQTSQSEYQALIDTVVSEVQERTGYDAYYTPMEIYTTFDLEQQDAVNGIMNSETYTFVNDVVQMGIAVTSVEDGSITAIGAGRNRVGERQFNFATQINRQIGSTAKPLFDYGPLIEYNDASTYTPFFDEKYTYSNGASVYDSDRKYLGLITMRLALARSRNIPALQAFQQVDKDKIAEFVHACGVDYGDTLYESAALGAFNGMSPLEMSAAYATFARGGYYIEPYSYTKIVIKESEEVIEYKPVKTKAMSKETAFMINYMLGYAVDRGIIGSVYVKGTDVAAKTGTSTIDKAATQKYDIPSSAIMDSWVSVYSPDYSFSIWYGYEKLSSDNYLTMRAASKVRSKVARILVSSLFEKNSRFPSGGAVTKISVELETLPAKLASANTPSDLITVEYFKKGTEPTETSTRFSTLNNPTNLKASYSTGTIKITWDKIATPDAIDTNYLQNYFNTYYGDWAEDYYQERLEYNSANIGINGYEVYLKDSSGNLTHLGFTTNNYYNYTASNTNTNYTFVVKSAYSIFKDNISSGVEVKANPYELTLIVNITMDEPTTTITKEDTLSYYEDPANPFIVYVNSVPTSDYTFTKKIYKVVDTVETEVTSIPKNSVANYIIRYSVIYNNKTYTASRKVNIVE